MASAFRFLIVLGGSIFFAICLVNFLLAKRVLPLGGPIVRLDANVVDLGHVQTGEVIHHSFVVHNAGQGELRFLGAKPECGCTVVSLPTGGIQPTCSDRIGVELNLDGYRGSISKSIFLQSNEVGAAPTVVTINAMVDSDLDFVVKSFSKESGGEVELYSRDGIQFRVVSARLMDITAEVAFESIDPDQRFRINIPGIDSKSPASVLLVSTDHPREGRVLIPLANKSRQ